VSIEHREEFYHNTSTMEEQQVEAQYAGWLLMDT
jgi:hypothetical protein